MDNLAQIIWFLQLEKLWFDLSKPQKAETEVGNIRLGIATSKQAVKSSFPNELTPHFQHR
jgi:hypothetical protein